MKQILQGPTMFRNLGFVIIGALFICSLPVSAFVGLYVGQNKEKTVVVLGDMHSADDARDTKHVQNVLEHIKGADSTAPVHLVVEIDKAAIAQVLRREKAQGVLAGSINELLTRLFAGGFVKEKKVVLIPAEGRGSTSDYLPQVLQSISDYAAPFMKGVDFFAAFKVDGTPPDAAAMLAPMEGHNTFSEIISKLQKKIGSKVSAGEFLAYLKKNRELMQKIKIKHDKSPQAAALITRCNERYDAALRELEPLLKKDIHLDMAKTIVSLFRKLDGSKKVVERYRQVYDLLLTNTDLLFEDVVLLDNILDSLNDPESKVIVSIMGEDHAKSIAAMFPALGLESMTVLTSHTFYGSMMRVENPNLTTDQFDKQLCLILDKVFPQKGEKSAHGDC